MKAFPLSFLRMRFQSEKTSFLIGSYWIFLHSLTMIDVIKRNGPDLKIKRLFKRTNSQLTESQESSGIRQESRT